MNQPPDSEVGQTRRLDCHATEGKIPKDHYDEYGFEKRRGVRLEFLPVFIPFSSLLAETVRGPSASMGERILPQQTLEYHVFGDRAAILQRDAVKEILAACEGKNFSMLRTLGRKPPTYSVPQPDLNNLKNYVLVQQKLGHQLLKEFE
jgi:hypothetical protein